MKKEIFTVKKFVKNYISSLDKIQKSKIENFKYDVWDFGYDKKISQKLIKLVLSGKKTATVGLFMKREKLPEAGNFGIIINHNKKPSCIIEYTKVEVKPFNEVDFDFVKSEGEGFKNINDWRIKHRSFFNLWYKNIFSNESLVVCENFKLLYPLSNNNEALNRDIKKS